METTNNPVHHEEDLEDQEKDDEKGREGDIETTEDDAKLETVVEEEETV